MEGQLEHPNNVNTCCEGQGTRMFGSLPEYIYSLSTNRSFAGSAFSSGPSGPEPFFASRSARRAHLTPQAHPGSLYRCSKST